MDEQTIKYGGVEYEWMTIAQFKGKLRSGIQTMSTSQFYDLQKAIDMGITRETIIKGFWDVTIEQRKTQFVCQSSKAEKLKAGAFGVKKASEFLEKEKFQDKGEQEEKKICTLTTEATKPTTDQPTKCLEYQLSYQRAALTFLWKICRGHCNLWPSTPTYLIKDSSFPMSKIEHAKLKMQEDKLFLKGFIKQSLKSQSKENMTIY